jgi:hypothetical protein
VAMHGLICQPRDELQVYSAIGCGVADRATRRPLQTWIAIRRTTRGAIPWSIVAKVTENCGAEVATPDNLAPNTDNRRKMEEKRLGGDFATRRTILVCLQNAPMLIFATILDLNSLHLPDVSDEESRTVSGEDSLNMLVILKKNPQYLCNTTTDVFDQRN